MMDGSTGDAVGQGQVVGGRPQLLKVDVEPGDAAFKKLMRNKVVVRAEVDGLGRSIFTVRARDSA
jgi:hypothetical protein